MRMGIRYPVVWREAPALQVIIQFLYIYQIHDG